MSLQVGVQQLTFSDGTALDVSPGEVAMNIIVNGEPREFRSGLTVSQLLQQDGYGNRRVAVEINGEIVPKSRHAEHALASGDEVEVVQAIGGG